MKLNGLDCLVFPLAFLWRHYLELVLKEIITTGRQLRCEERGESPVTHKLHCLWEIAKPYITEHGPPDALELANIEANIAELEKIDPWSTGFRYLLDRKQESTGLVDPPTEINLGVFQEAMVAVSNFLEAVSGGQLLALSDCLSSARE